MDIPSNTLMIIYAVYSLFLFYQQLHLRNFQGSNELYRFLLGIFAFGGMLYGFAFLIYWGYTVSWVQALVLFGIGFGIKILWFQIESFLGLRNFYWLFSFAGFVVLPIVGYDLWKLLP